MKCFPDALQIDLVDISAVADQCAVTLLFLVAPFGNKGHVFPVLGGENLFFGFTVDADKRLGKHALRSRNQNLEAVLVVKVFFQHEQASF